MNKVLYSNSVMIPSTEYPRIEQSIVSAVPRKDEAYLDRL